MPSKESESVLTRFTAAVKSSSRPRQPMPGTVYTSVGFKKARAPLKSSHSIAEHLFRHFIPFGAACIGKPPMEPPVLPPSRHNPIPSTAVSILGSCGRCPQSAAEMIAPLSGCDLFMLPIKLISPHIVVKA